MVVKKMVITIDEFDDAAMTDDTDGEVAAILQKLMRRVERNGVQECDGVRLFDSNGNTVGHITVELGEADDDDEDDGDDCAD